MTLYDICSWILFVLLGIFAVGAYLNLCTERRRMAAGFRGAVLRLLLCVLFSLTAFVSGSMWRESFEIRSGIYFTGLDVVAAGLLFCIPGVFFSAYTLKDARFSAFSAISLTAAQLLFFAAVTLTHLFDGWLFTLIIAGGLLCILPVLQRLGRRQGGYHRGLSLLYMIFCALAAGKAGAGFFRDPEGTSLLLFSGCALFFAGGLLATNPRRSFCVSTVDAAAAMLTAFSCGPLFA